GAVGDGGLLIGGGEVGDLDVVQGQASLLEHRGQQVAAGGPGPARDTDLVALQFGDGGDRAVVDELLADLEGGRGVLGIARRDPHRADDLEGQALIEGVEHAGAEPGDHHVELIGGEQRDAVLTGLQRGQLDGDAGLLEESLRIGDVQRGEQRGGHVADTDRAAGAGGVTGAAGGVLPGDGGAAGGEGAAERGGGGEGEQGATSHQGFLGVRGVGAGGSAVAAPGQQQLLAAAEQAGEDGTDDADHQQAHVELLRDEQLPGVPDQVAEPGGGGAGELHRGHHHHGGAG